MVSEDHWHNTTGMDLRNVSSKNDTSLARILLISELNDAVFHSILLPTFIYLCFLLVIGVSGNALVCYVYHFKVRNRQLSSNIFILALAWFDLINCAISLPIEILIILNYYQYDVPVLCKLSRFLTFFCNNASSTILLAIAIDRLVAFVSGPVRRRLKPFMSKIIVFVAVCVAASVSWPMLIFFGTRTFSLGRNLVGKSCHITNKYIGSTAVVVFTISLLSVHILFDVLFLVIYSIIGKKICYDSGVSYVRSLEKEQIRKLGDSISSNDELFVTQEEACIINSNNRSPSLCRFKLRLIPKESSSSVESNIINQDSIRRHERESKAINDYMSPKRTSSGRLSSSIKSLFAKNRNRSSSNLSESKIFNRRTSASRTSLMLFIVTMAYVISFMPYCVIVVLRHATEGNIYNKLNNPEKAVYQLFLRSYALSSAINPVIYSFVNVSFRRKCKMAIYDLFHFLTCLTFKSRR